MAHCWGDICRFRASFGSPYYSTNQIGGLCFFAQCRSRTCTARIQIILTVTCRAVRAVFYEFCDSKNLPWICFDVICWSVGGWRSLFLQVLERGPTHYHQVVLGLLCSLMKYGDFSSPSMRQFQNDALKTISKYLKVSGDKWIDIKVKSIQSS